MRFRLIFAGLAAATLLAVGCGGLVDPANNQTQTFTGTISPGAGSADVHTFTVSQRGEYFVTFTSLVPPPAQATFPADIQVTLASSGQCIFNSGILGDNQSSVVGKQALNGEILQTGLYCLWIVNEGFFPTTETYTITVSHP